MALVITGALLFNQPGWMIPALILLLCMSWLVWSCYRVILCTGQARNIQRVCQACKWMVFAILLLTLLEPIWSANQVKPGANLFLVMCDNSQSMQLKDKHHPEGRLATLHTILENEKSPWQIQLGELFDVRKHHFDTQVRTWSRVSEITGQGELSLFSGMLQWVQESFSKRPVAGILLLTDGNATDGDSLDEQRDFLNLPQSKQTHALHNLPPIYPVIIGSEQGLSDAGIERVSVNTTSFEDAPVTITAVVNVLGVPDDRDLVAELYDEQDQLIKREKKPLSPETKTITFRFQFRPAESGLSFYRLKLSAPGEHHWKESTLANNERWITVDRGAGPYRLLYVSGRPNWEYKFLRRGLESDEQIDMLGLIRIAKREAKFDWRGRAGEGSNPLFRGFDKVNEETERFDQPVIVRLNTQNAEELRDGFPKTAAELFQLHGIILDDVEADFFTAEQLELLEKFVSERGGGLLMCGGQESFYQGGYARTSLARLLPVYLDAKDTTIPSPEGVKLVLSREGWLQPWARLRLTEADEQLRLQQLPPFQTYHSLRSIKPGAQSIAEMVNLQGNKLPAFVVHRYGQGRAAALLIGDMWRMQLAAQDETVRGDLGKVWRQTLRWLIADVPEPITLQAHSVMQAGQPMIRLDGRARTKEFKPQDAALVKLAITPPTEATAAGQTEETPEQGKNPSVKQPGSPGQKTTVKMLAEPSLEEPGLYTSTASLKRPGIYLAEMEVQDAQNQSLGKTHTGWTYEPATLEWAKLTPNTNYLQQLAERTGGKVLKHEDLNQWVETLASRPAPVSEAVITPLWHHPFIWMLLLVALCLEWGLRRWYGWA